MMVDTGATLVILSRKDAQRADINPTQEEYIMPATTANGVALLAPVVLDEVVVGVRCTTPRPPCFPTIRFRTDCLGCRSFLNCRILRSPAGSSFSSSEPTLYFLHRYRWATLLGRCSRVGDSVSELLS
jgi:gag-polyprotein putative aspartyl protease